MNPAVSEHLKNIGIVSSLTMVSRVLGLARDMLVTAVFGAQGLASAFVTAFTLPNLFRRLLGEGALTAALVPTLHEELDRGGRDAAFALVNRVASWLLVVTGVLVGIAVLALSRESLISSVLQSLGAGADTSERWLQAAGLAVVLFPYLVLVCLAAALSAALQTLDRFLEPALSPIWLNLAMIALLAVSRYGGGASDSEGWMLWLCAGVLLGGLLQMAVPAGALARQGWRPRFDLSVDGPLSQVARLMGPMVFGSAIYLINLAVARFIGLSLNDSAVMILNLSTRLMELPIGVFTIAVSTVLFPLIARHAASGDAGNLAREYLRGMRLVLVINIPAAIGLVALGGPLIQVLFERGEFGTSDTSAMVPVLAAAALGLPFFSFVNLVLRAYYARKDTSTPVRAATLSFVVNLVLSIVLMRSFSTTGLALASTLAIAVQAWFLQTRLARRFPELAFHHLTSDLLRICLASLCMGLAVAGGWSAWSRLAPDVVWMTAVGVMLFVGLGIAVYGALLWAFRVEGREDALALVRRVGDRFRG